VSVALAGSSGSGVAGGGEDDVTDDGDALDALDVDVAVVAAALDRTGV